MGLRIVEACMNERVGISVDETKCIRSGICATLAPEIFRMPGDAYRAPTTPEGDVPYEIALQDAQDLCPSQAIQLTPAEGDFPGL